MYEITTERTLEMVGKGLNVFHPLLTVSFKVFFSFSGAVSEGEY